jgi:putative ubiquitin-RnfH superfamily antitoxin RatB of RatAB toxin-antitoxin module
MSSLESIRVSVAYALPEEQAVVELTVEPGCTALQAAQRSGLAARYPALDLSVAKLGIFAHVLDDASQHILKEGDRVEIYRSLLLDPKEARRQRAEKSRRALVKAI